MRKTKKGSKARARTEATASLRGVRKPSNRPGKKRGKPSRFSTSEKVTACREAFGTAKTKPPYGAKVAVARKLRVHVRTLDTWKPIFWKASANRK